jgi:hypothetical protein
VNRPVMCAALLLIALGAWGLWPSDETLDRERALEDVTAEEIPAAEALRRPTSPDARRILARAGISGASFMKEDWDPFEEQEAWRQRSAPSARAPVEFAGARKLGTGEFVTDETPLSARKEKR